MTVRDWEEFLSDARQYAAAFEDHPDPAERLRHRQHSHWVWQQLEAAKQRQ